MILFICLIFLIIGGAMFWYGLEEFEDKTTRIGGFLFIVGFCLGVFGAFHGFVNYPASEGVHQGTITAVDREGYIFNHYRIYLKSNGRNVNDDNSISDETEYCLYLNESELANIAKEYIGKTVKIYYSHPGGYIGIRSCGTYHIDKIELVEE